MTSLAPSRFNILVPLSDGGMLAYNSLSHATAVWGSAETDLFERVSRGEGVDPSLEAIGELEYGGFIISTEFDELALLQHRYDESRNDPSRMLLTITPTLMCNFGCDYCFQGADKPAGRMARDVQDAIIALVTRTAPSVKRLHVAWYGGEPLLALGVIEALSNRLIAACQAKGVAYDATIVTNGYKLTLDVARSLAFRQVTVAQITLDGGREEHDRRRFRLGGGGSFDRIVANLKAVVDAVPMMISIRINIDQRNAASVHDLLDELQRQGFARRKNFGVYFAPVEAITEGCHNVVGDCMTKSAYGELETELTRYAYEAGLCSLPYPPRFRGVCGALRPKGFVVLPNGDVHKCWDTVASAEQRVGTIFDIDALATNKRAQSWAAWSPFDNPICRNCKILPNCAGSCAHKFLNPDQTLGEAASLPCPSWKYNINERLVLTAERNGLITADDYDALAIKTDPATISPLPLSATMAVLGPRAPVPLHPAAQAEFA